MAISDLFHLFARSLKMMAHRGYCIEEYRSIIDLYDISMHFMKNNQNIPEELESQISEVEIFKKVRHIMKGTHDFQNSSKTIEDNFTFSVINYETCDQCLISYYDLEDGSFLAGDLQKLTKNLEHFSEIKTGDSDFCKPESNISAIIILNGKLGSNPREKIKKIHNIEYLEKNVVLSSPYNNVMQSQHQYMSEEESVRFLETNKISKQNMPSISKAKDSYANFINAKSGTIDRVYRYKISTKEPLDVTPHFVYLR